MRMSCSTGIGYWLCTGLIVILLTILWSSNIVTIPTALGETKDNKKSGSPAQPSLSKSTSSQSQVTEHNGPKCFAVDKYFADEVWSKVGERSCLKCHNTKGDAAGSEFLLHDIALDQTAMRKNQVAFLRIASAKEEGNSRLLAKVKGGLDHGGKVVLKADSTGYKILARFVHRASGKPISMPKVDSNAPPFFEGIKMMSPLRLLRRTTLSLVGRLPTHEERSAVKKSGLKAMDAILDDIMQEDAFYERLREAFNDILLTRGYDGVAEGALSYEHFKTRLWYQDRSPRKGLSLEDARKMFPYSHPKMIAHTKLVREYREGMRREPLELITFIVRNNHPFTEIVTADYIMVSPYTSRGYGIYEEVKEKFDDPDNPFEFIPTKIKALKSRNGRQAQKSATGFFPHAGLLSSFQYMKRYPTTESNRNRLRVRMYFEHFLGIDILQLAPRVNDAAAITAKYDVPTMQASDCVVCHKFMDPIAGLYQDYYVVDGKGIYGPRKTGWFKDMFPPGLEGEEIPKEQRWRSLQWLGERTAKDPRFAIAMVKHVWYILSGRKPLLPPEDIDDPLFASKLRAYRTQRNEIEQVAVQFKQANYNLKHVFKKLVQSQFYRADGLATAAKSPNRLAELDDIGIVRMLTPEQLERKLTAIFGQKWGRLTDRESKFKILYGGIDSKTVTERITDPSGAMGAIQRIMANDVACKNVALDFSKEPNQRRLFPNIELDVVPNTSSQSEAKIRDAIVHLHLHLLGQYHKSSHQEVERTYQLFSGIVSDAKASQRIEKVGSYHCDRVDSKRLADPHYTLRAWRGVVTYLLRQHNFLYE